MLNLQDNFPLKKITTLQIGGSAKKFVQVKTPQQLIEAIQYANQNNLDYLVIGDGGGAGSKLKKAKALQESGATLQILSEKEFLALL